MVPADHLRPHYRCAPDADRGVFTIALDPREAAFLLARGWATLDGVRYRIGLGGCDGLPELDGRVMVRCEIDVVGCLTYREAIAKAALDAAA